MPIWDYNYLQCSFRGNYSRKYGTAIPRDMLPLDMLTPQIRHYELWQKNSRYANFSDFLTPSYAIFDFVEKKSRYANFSALFTPSYAIMNCVQKF